MKKTVLVLFIFTIMSLIHGIEVPQICKSLSGHSDTITSISRIGKYQWIVSGSEDGTIKIWNKGKASLIKTITVGFPIVSVIGLPNSDYLAYIGPKKDIFIVNYITGELFKMLSGHSEMVRAIAYVEGTKLLVSASDDKTLKIWNYETGQLINNLIGHSAKITSVISVINTEYVVSGSIAGEMIT